MSLHDRRGHRLYRNAEERAAFLSAAQHFPHSDTPLAVMMTVLFTLVPLVLLPYCL